MARRRPAGVPGPSHWRRAARPLAKHHHDEREHRASSLKDQRLNCPEVHELGPPALAAHMCGAFVPTTIRRSVLLQPRSARDLPSEEGCILDSQRARPTEGHHAGPGTDLLDRPDGAHRRVGVADGAPSSHPRGRGRLPDVPDAPPAALPVAARASTLPTAASTRPRRRSGSTMGDDWTGFPIRARRSDTVVTTIRRARIAALRRPHGQADSAARFMPSASSVMYRSVRPR